MSAAGGGLPGAGLLGVDEHLRECLALAVPLPPADLPLLDALGRVLAEDVVAPAPLPGADNSGMDGYAVRCADVAGASEATPVELPVVGDVAAGEHAAPLAPGTAVRIMTGGVVPAGADGVVPVEQTDGGTDVVRLRAEAVPGRFVRRAGSDVAAGEVVARVGDPLDPRRLSLLTAVGRASVRVRPAPRVVVMSTGDEVVAPGAPLRPGQVHDSNGVGVAAAALELGCRVTRAGAVPDDPDGFRAALADALGAADVLVTTGGVSAGAFDVVKAVLRDSGTVRFRRVAVQPGMPQGLGVLRGADGRDVPVFCLPGNPVSAMVSFEVFVRPALRTVLGERDVLRPTVPATVRGGWASPEGKRQYARVRLERSAGGGLVCEAVGGQGSHLVADLATADALAVVPEAVTAVAEGDTLECLLVGAVPR
ncbi:molybdotransferase-like divisome protein Glp [Aquipuribacter sp. SD81]|uniref:molybdotransferase-like divisome protein Glp n=1 Tax=Aquipuribacter sp. SD81 TaxID=3127703 RepID=UPI003019CCD6